MELFDELIMTEIKNTRMCSISTHYNVNKRSIGIHTLIIYIVCSNTTFPNIKSYMKIRKIKGKRVFTLINYISLSTISSYSFSSRYLWRSSSFAKA